MHVTILGGISAVTVHAVSLLARLRRPRCPRCDGRLGVQRVRVAEGHGWRGPYWRCEDCGTSFETHDGVLVPSE